ncbi:MAG: MFS transporter [Enterobacteriaceae bacterium]
MLFIELLDTTITHTALTKIATEFHVTYTQALYSVAYYLLGTCVLVPTIGFIRQRFNPKVILATAMVLFACTSISCVLANNVATFSFSRFMQGISISIPYPLLSILLYENKKPIDIIKINSFINIPGLIGMALGPFLGALLTKWISWRLAFMINIPFIIITLLFLYKFDMTVYHQQRKINFDWPGFILLSGGLCCATFGLATISSDYLSRWHALSLIATGFVLFLIYFILFMKNEHARIIDFNIFSQRNYQRGIVINFFCRILLGGMPFLIIFLVEQTTDHGIIRSGVALLLLALSACVAKFFVNTFIDRIGIVRANYFFSVLCLFSIVAYMIPVYSHSYWQLCLITILYGTICSCQATAMNAIMLIDMPQDLIASASTMQSITQQYFVSIGVSLYGMLTWILHDISQHVTTEYISFLLLTFMFVTMSCGISGLYLLDRYHKPPFTSESN